MSEILIFWLSALVSQMAPYLIFILLQKSTHSVNMVLSSQNARLCRNCVLIRPTNSSAARTTGRTKFCSQISDIYRVYTRTANVCDFTQ